MDYILSFVALLIKELPNWVGFLLPFVVQILNLHVQKESERYVISVVVCVFVAGAINCQDIAFGNPSAALLSMSKLFAESNIFYTLYFSKSGMRAGLIQLLGGTTDLHEPLEKVKPQEV